MTSVWFQKGGNSVSEHILHVQTLGKFTLTYGDRQLVSSSRSKLIWNILAYLLCHRSDFISTEELISVVWSQEKNDNPSGAMRTAIHRARSLLKELDEDVDFLISRNGGYKWNPNIEIVTDIGRLENLAEAVSKDPNDLSSCLAALDLYRGKFLPLQSSELWVMPIQTYYHNLYLWLLDRTVPLLEKGLRCAEGIRICNQALKIDPYSEKIYQYLMRFLLIDGERQEVIRVYEEMSKLLLSTFGTLPDQESRNLYREALEFIKNTRVVTPEDAKSNLTEQGEINGALLCDYDFFRMMYQAQARAIVRSGQVIHTALLTMKSRHNRNISEKSLALAMDNLEKHLCRSLRKGDLITRCSSSQFLVMLPSANYENSCKVCQRLITSYEKKYPHSPVYIDFYVQALNPSTRS